MQLQKLQNSGNLVYFNNGEEKLSIHETEHFRWLSFDNTVQSVMHKKKPHLLTIRHQIALMLPLLFKTPRHLCEIGLGGGNISRFIKAIPDSIDYSSIEVSEVVKQSFNRYFNPGDIHINFIESSCPEQLEQAFIEDVDWWIIDIFSNQESRENSTTASSADTNDICRKLPHYHAIISALIKNKGCLSINIPIGNLENLTTVIESVNRLTNIEKTHSIKYFNIPGYRKFVMHVLPLDLLPLIIHMEYNARAGFTACANSTSNLNNRTKERWLKFWAQGHNV